MNHDPPSTIHQPGARLWMLYLVVFAATFSCRFLAIAGFPNDHYVYLAGARQLLGGEWPSRDFDDPGQTLMYVASAGMQLLLGRTLFAEAVLVAIAFAGAAALTTAAVVRRTGSMGLGMAAAVLEVAIFPRSYGYPKLLLYAAGVWLMWRYVSHRSTPRLLAMAALAAVACLFRHDHGVFLGVAGVLTIVLASPDGWRDGTRRAALYAAAVIVCLLPYVAYLTATVGVADHIRSGLTFNRAEAERSPLVIPAFVDRDRLPAGCADASAPRRLWCVAAASAVPWLFFTVWLLPFIGMAVLAVAPGERARGTVAAIVPLCVLAVLVNRFFLREPLAARLPDAIVPAVLLGAWLAARAWASRERWNGRLALAAAIVATIATGAASAAIGESIEQLDRIGVFNGVTFLPSRYAERAAELRERFARRQIPNTTIVALLSVFDYIDRCTSPQHRLLVPGFAPEIPVYARRLFAGGQSTFRYPATPAEHRRIRDHVTREVVPLALLASDWDAAVRMLYPELDGFIRTRFVPLADIPVHEERTVHVLVNRTLTAVRQDQVTGWPCFQ